MPEIQPHGVVVKADTAVIARQLKVEPDAELRQDVAVGHLNFKNRSSSNKSHKLNGLVLPPRTPDTLTVGAKRPYGCRA